MFSRSGEVDEDTRRKFLLLEDVYWIETMLLPMKPNYVFLLNNYRVYLGDDGSWQI